MSQKPGIFQQEETPIDREIAGALANLMPEDWDAIRLVLRRLPFDPSGLAHSIQSPEGHTEVVEPDDELYAATLKLEQLFARHGKQFKSARYELEYNDEGDLDYEVRFEY